MSIEAWILTVQAIGLPMLGWIVKLVHQYIKKIDRRFEALEKKQDEIIERLELLEAA